MIHLALLRSVPGGHARRTALLAVVLLAAALFGAGIARATPARAQDPYPAPAIPEIDPIEDAPTAGENTQPYPAPDATVPGVVGQDSPAIPGQSSAPLIDVPAAAPAQSPAGLYFLWGSFLAALLIFATAVVGAVVLFARRVE